jgi:diaminopropionate ammonia-lyase
VTLQGDCETIMAGLACNTPSSLAWDLMDQGVDVFMICADAAVPGAMTALAEGAGGDPVIVAGETGAAGLAALRVAAADSEMRAALGLDQSSHVLIFGTEGATDPVLYEKIVGRPAAMQTQAQQESSR